MNRIQEADLKNAEALRGQSFVANGMRHEITAAYFADYADEVMVEVLVLVRPDRSCTEILSIHELNARMGR